MPQKLNTLSNAKPGKGVMKAYEVVRKYVKFLDKNRPLYPDIEKLTQVLKTGEMLREIQSVVGELK